MGLILLSACSSKDEPVADAAAQPATSVIDSAAAVSALADEYVTAYFDTFPEQALFSGAPDPDPARLGDHSLESLARWQVYQQDLLGRWMPWTCSTG
jgi:hypothetical protein